MPRLLNTKTRSAIDPNKSKYRLPKIKLEPSIKLYCRMSNIDDDEILELEISDDKTFGFRGVGSPGKKRKVAEEVLDTGFPVETNRDPPAELNGHSSTTVRSGQALIHTVHSVILQFSLESQHLSKPDPAGLPRTCSIRNSSYQIRPQ